MNGHLLFNVMGRMKMLLDVKDKMLYKMRLANGIVDVITLSKEKLLYTNY